MEVVQRFFLFELLLFQEGATACITLQDCASRMRRKLDERGIPNKCVLKQRQEAAVVLLSSCRYEVFFFFMQMKRFPGISRGSIRGPHGCSGLANLFKKLRAFEEQDQQKIMQTCQQDCGVSRWDLWFYDLDNSEAASLEILHSADCFITSRAF